MWWRWAHLYSGHRASWVHGNGRWNTVCEVQSSARGTSWLSPLLPCRPCCRPALPQRPPSPRGSGAPPRPLMATWGWPLHTPPLPALCPRPSPGSRGIFSLWSVLTPLIRPQPSFAFSPSFPDFPVLLSSFWPRRCGLSVLLSQVCDELSYWVFVVWVSLVGFGGSLTPYLLSLLLSVL